jgi:hypothetical protein
MQYIFLTSDLQHAIQIVFSEGSQYIFVSRTVVSNDINMSLLGARVSDGAKRREVEPAERECPVKRSGRRSYLC